MQARSPVMAILAFCILPLLSHGIIVATGHVRLGLGWNGLGLFRLGFVGASALAHWAIYSGLLLLFGRTLLPGHEPLITGMARRMHFDVHGAMAAELAIYTRRVTLAWCCFFAAQLTMSVTLFLAAPLVVWSFFVNVLDIPLVAAMFAAEYFCRLRLLRDPPKHSLAAIVEMVAGIRKPVEDTVFPS